MTMRWSVMVELALSEGRSGADSRPTKQLTRSSRFLRRLWRSPGCGPWLFHRFAYWRGWHPDDPAPWFTDVAHLVLLLRLLAFAERKDRS